MRLHALALGLLLFAVPALAGPTGETIPGENSTVTLLEVAPVASAVPKLSIDGTNDGVQLVFLVVSKPGEKQKLQLGELRDVQIAGNSYAETTKQKLGKEFEPKTKLFDVQKFAETRPDLAKPLNAVPANAKGVVIVTAIGGAPLPTKGAGSASLEVGWGKDTETFKFVFDLKQVLAAAKLST